MFNTKSSKHVSLVHFYPNVEKRSVNISELMESRPGQMLYEPLIDFGWDGADRVDDITMGRRETKG